MSLSDLSHARRNALTGEWVLVSPHRTERPWQGQMESAETSLLPHYDPDCYLCPGNRRANQQVNPDYRGPFAFDNDFPALSDATRSADTRGLFQNRSEAGRCRVICYTERHDLTLATMAQEDVERAVAAWADEFARLDRQGDYRYVQWFENRGRMMGASNPHPHAQIWATEHLPNEPAKELKSQQDWWQRHGSALLADYRDAEIRQQIRVVFSNAHFIAVVPYWAVWPYETLILPHANLAAPDQLNPAQRAGLAECLQRVLGGYNRFFGVPAPYSMGFHPRPSDGQAHPEWLFHAHIYPPLLRSASIRKHMVGFEMMAMPQRDLTPEAAAQRLAPLCAPTGEQDG